MASWGGTDAKKDSRVLGWVLAVQRSGREWSQSRSAQRDGTQLGKTCR